MKQLKSALILLAIASGLAGCARSGEEELREWMTELRSTTKPRITPLDEPKTFTPAEYNAQSGADPFSSVRLTQALRRDSNSASVNTGLITPELQRRKEPLEAYPLDAIRMVGSMNKSGVPIGLVKVDALLYQVRTGNYLGQNYGRVLKITETNMQLRELVQDASGDWVEKMTTLDLQEGPEVKK